MLMGTILALVLCSASAWAGVAIPWSEQGQTTTPDMELLARDRIPTQSLSVDGAVDFHQAQVYGANYLRKMQADITEDNAGNGNPDSPDDPDDGGWDWRVTSPPAPFSHTTSASSTNLYGATALGLYYTHLEFGGVSYLLAMTDAADTMIYNPNVRSGSDLIFLMQYNDLSSVSGTEYQDSARAKYDARMTSYGGAQAFAEFVRDYRGVTNGYPNGIIAWDVGVWVRVAAMLDARFPGNGYDADADAMAEVLYQDSYMDNPGYFDIVDDAGFDPDYNDVNFYWYNLGISGLIDAFVAADLHTSEIPDLVDRLLASQANHGGVSYCYGANPGDDDWQTTAYAMMTLGRLDQVGYQSQIDEMGYFLAATQDPSGGWLYSSGNHYPEVCGEATAGLYYTSNTAVYDLADALVDDDFTWQGDVDVYNDAHGTNFIWEYDAFATIQEAIDVVDGSTVLIAPGTYYETLNITLTGLQLVGEDRATVIIDPTGLASNNSGIYVDADNVTIESLTLQSTATNSLPRYGIKFGQVDGCSLIDVTVRDVYRSGVDALGTSNLTVSGVTCINNGGHGLSLVDCNGVDVSDLTVSGNAWQGVSVATWGNYTPLGVSGIVFSGTNSFSDVFQLEMGDYNNPGVAPSGDAIITYSTNISDGADVTVQASDFGFAVHGEQDDSPDQVRVWFVPTLTDAATVLSLAPIGHLTGNDMYIEDLVDVTQLYVTPNGSIQAAIDAADPYDLINVSAGTYVEALSITKPLSLFGATAGVNKNGYAVPTGYTWDDAVETIIMHPDPASGYMTIVDIYNTDDVTFDGFVVQELSAVANQNTSLVRVYAYSQEIGNIQVVNNVIGPNTNTVSQDGAQGRMGLYIVNHPYDDNGVVNSSFAGNKIFDCKGNGDNVFIWSSYYAYGAPGPASMAGTVIEDNEIYGSHRSGIETAGGFSDLVIRNNEIYDNVELPGDDPDKLKYGHGILLIRGSSDKVSDPLTAYGPVNLTIEGNNIYGNSKSGIYTGPKNDGVMIIENAIHDNGWNGVIVDLLGNYWNAQFEPAPADSQYACFDCATDIQAHGNDIYGNGTAGNPEAQYGVVVNGDPTNGFIFDAEENWWGTIDYPVISGLVSGEVDFDPWCSDASHTNCTLSYPVTEVWVDDDWTGYSPGDQVGGHTFGYDAFVTIQEGINAVTGSTVNVAAGTYVEDLVVDKSLTMIGAGPGSTLITPTGTGPAITVTADDVMLSQIGITHPTQLVEGVRVAGAAANLTLDYVDITNLGNNPGPGNAFGVNITNTFAGLTVSNSNFIATNLGEYSRAIGIFAGNNFMLSDFAVSGSVFEYLFVGIYLRSDINGLDVDGNTFGPFEIEDCTAAVAGIYIGDGSLPNFDIQNISVTGNLFTDYGRGVYMWNYAHGEAILNVDISGNTFNNSIWSAGIRLIGQLDPATQVAVIEGPITIDDNTFTQSVDIGGSGGVGLIDFRSGGESATSQIAVTDNEITFTGSFSSATYGVVFRGPITNATVSGNMMDGGNVGGANGGPPNTTAIYVATDDSWLGPLSSSAVLDISNNYITGFENGIAVYDRNTATFGNLPTGATLAIHDNSITGNTLSVKSGAGETADASGNWWGAVDPATVAVGFEGPVDYTPWLATGTDTDPIATGFQGSFGTLYVDDDSPQAGSETRLIEAIGLVTSSTIYLTPGTYAEGPQVVIDSDLDIIGDASSTVTIVPTANTGSSGDARGWFLVQDGIALNMSKVTLDGDGFNVYQGIRHKGSGFLDDIVFKNMIHPGYAGTAVAAFGSGVSVSIIHSEFDNIGRIGALMWVPGTFAYNTYTGKGDGDWLDYGIDMNAGAIVDIVGNTFTECTGVASSDGSTSAGVLVTTYYGPGTNAILEDNLFTGCSAGLNIGYDEYDASTVSVTNNNRFLGNEYGIVTSASSSTNLTCYGNIFNNTCNADDDAGGMWDDGVSVGNCWADFAANAGYPTYYLVGGDAGAIDHYPSVDCGIDLTPDDIVYHCDGNFTFDVNVNEAITNLEAGSFVFVYDAGLTVVDVASANPEVTLAGDRVENGTTFDTLYVDFLIGTGSVTGPAALFRVEMNGIVSFCGGTEITPFSATLFNSDNEQIAVTMPAPITLVADCDDPEFVLNGPAAGSYYNTAPVVDIAASDNCDIDAVYYQIDDCLETGWIAVAGPGYNGTSWSDAAWIVPGFSGLSESEHCVHFKVIDDNARSNADSCTYSWCFHKDISAPAPPTDFTAEPGHNKVHLDWTASASGDVTGYVIQRVVWGDYPLYDTPEPSYPADHNTGDNIFDGSATSYVDTYLLDNTTRDIYYYAIFAYDAAGNYSVLDASAQARSTSYWLGDVADDLTNFGVYNGYVNHGDLYHLGFAYWKGPGNAGWQPEADWGPTADGNPHGVPTPDDTVNVFDLAIFAINYGTVNPTLKAVPLFAETETNGPLDLTLGFETVESQVEYVLRLNNARGDAKIIHTAIECPTGIDLDGYSLAIEETAEYPVFVDVREVNDRIEIDFALLGNGLAIKGSGDLVRFRLKTDGAAPSLELVEGIVINNDNEQVDVDLVNVAKPGDGLPRTFALSQNYPNPFNPSTQIDFQLPQAAHVTLEVYNLVGQRVAILVNERLDPGYHTAVWHGDDQSGNPVSSGVYFYRLRTEDVNLTRKMMLVK